MNIWIFNHYAITPKSSGGTRHFDLAKELVNKNYNVKIFASSFEHHSVADTNIINPKEKVKIESIDDIQFVWIKTCEYKKNDFRRVWNILGYTFGAFLTAIRSKEKPDLIIGSLMHPPAALLGYIISKIKGSKFYFEERDLWPQTLIDLGKVSKRNPIVKLLSWLEIFLYKKSDRIIILFKNAVNYIEGKGISKEKVLVIPNGVDIKRFDNAKELPNDLDVFLNIKLKDHFKAIYIGSHGMSDNLEPLLLSAKKLIENNSKVCLLFFGKGPEKERLIKFKEEEKLENVIFFPSVAKEYIPKLLESCDVGLLSMHNAELYKWGMSFNKMYDYMAAKLPIVVNSKMKVGELDEFGNIVWAQNPIEMAETLDSLSLDSHRCERLGANGKSYLEKNFNWEMLSQKLVTVLEQDLK